MSGPLRWNLFTQDTTIIIVSVPSNALIPDATNTPIDPTEAFKTIIFEIIEYLPFLIAPISYETKTLLLQLEDLKQELINDSAI